MILAWSAHGAIITGMLFTASDDPTDRSSAPLLSTASESYSLSELGAPDNPHTEIVEAEPVIRTFRLPPNVKQGNPAWYVLHLNARIIWPTTGTDGKWNLSADVNGYTGASINLERRDGATQIESLSLLGGRKGWTDDGTQLDIRFSNYAQEGGFKAGDLNVLTFRIDDALRTPNSSTPPTAGGPVVQLSDDSGIEVTTTSPAEIGLGLPRRVEASPGATVEIPFALTRRGAQPDRPVEVRAEPSSGVEMVGRARQRFESLNEGKDGHFAVRVPQQEGTHKIYFRVESDYNKVGALVEVLSRRDSGQDVVTGSRVVAASVFGLSTLGLVLSRRIPRRRTGKD